MLTRFTARWAASASFSSTTARTRPAPVAQHAAVAVRIGQPRGEQAEGASAAASAATWSPGSMARRRTAPARARRRARRPAPAPRRGRCPAARPAAPSAGRFAGECGLHLFAAVAVDHMDRAGCSARAASSTCASSGRPASGISTFGRCDFIRVPAPAARIRMCNGALFMRTALRCHKQKA